MARKKVKLMWIVNDAARRASLKKRRVGPDDPEPAFWPSRPDVQRLVTRFRNIPVMERCKKMMDQESYLKERMGKQNDQFRKHLKKNRDLEMADLMQQVYQDKGFDGLDQTQLCGLAWLVAEKMKDIRRRVEYFQQIPPLQDPSIPPGPFLLNTLTRLVMATVMKPEAKYLENLEMGGTILQMAYEQHFWAGPLSKQKYRRHQWWKYVSSGLPPHDNDILRGRSSGGNNFDLWLPIESNMIGCNNAGNSFDPRLPRGLGFNPGGNTSAGNNFDLGLARGNDTRSDGTGGNNYDLWLHHVENVGGNSAAAAVLVKILSMGCTMRHRGNSGAGDSGDGESI
ncbi:hypothetical protein NC651_035295 [Populus alba x Populus x berolinensis]|nr:hypothetical protein NC651_035295 [Populus alba x Populus x berolinensis]